MSEEKKWSERHGATVIAIVMVLALASILALNAC